MSIQLLKEMFSEMVIKKDPELISRYYHPDFLMVTNGLETDYAVFLESHLKYYATPIQYKIAYDEETLLEQNGRVAGRVWITTSRPNESPREIEVILIVQYRDRKIYRLWELTYPDWSKLPAFKS